MLDTYVGGVGTFPKGHKLDLPPDITEQIPKGCYEKTCAPWDVKLDAREVELAQARTKAKDAQIWADLQQDKADKAKEELLAFNEPLGAARNAAKAVKKKDSKDKAAQKIFWQHRKAEGQYEVLLAVRALKELEADEAKQQAEAAAEAAEQLKSKAAEKKAKKMQNQKPNNQSTEQPTKQSTSKSMSKSMESPVDKQMRPEKPDSNYKIK